MMSTGGNARGRAFFKDHGWDELGTDKITTKVLLCCMADRATAVGAALLHGNRSAPRCTATAALRSTPWLKHLDCTLAASDILAVPRSTCPGLPSCTGPSW